MDFNESVINYLNKFYADAPARSLKVVDTQRILGELMTVFNIPPGRALEIVSRWGKTYSRKNNLLKARAAINHVVPCLALMALFSLNACDQWKRSTGTNDTVVNPGAGMLQRKTMTVHQGLIIFSDDRLYHETGTKLTFTPLSAHSHITIRATGTAVVNAVMPESPVDITLYRDNLDLLDDDVNTRPYRLLSGASDFNFDPSRGVVDTQAPVALEFTENSPGAGVAVTYAVRIRTGDAPPLPNLPPRYYATWCWTGGTALYSSIVVEEWQDQ